jgi:hypothetical protein
LANPKPDDLVARIRRLPQTEQRRALAYVEHLEHATQGRALLSLVNTIPAEDLEEMALAIEADCESVDADAW